MFKNIKPETALERINNIDAAQISEEKIEFSKLPPGRTEYFLARPENYQVADIARDSFSPWSGKSRDGKRETSNIHYRFLCANEAGFQVCQRVTETRLKIIRNTHPTISGLKREIIYIEEHKKPISPVLYVYTTQNDIELPEIIPAARILPSQSQVLKEALKGRTSRNAKMVLEREGIETSTNQLSSLSRSVSDHLKTSRGRRAPTDFHKIFDRYLAESHPEELIETPVIERKEDGKINIRIMVAFPDAFKSFVKNLPTTEDVEQHRTEIKRTLEMSERDATRIFNSYLETTNVSGSIPCIGSCVMIDTTFSLCSAEYVTVVLGVSETFKSSSSKKCASILLAYMVHSSKELVEHESFSCFLNKLFMQYGRGTCLNLIVHDGETSFRVYNEGQYLKDSIVLRCDVHRLNNLKHAMKSRDPEEFEELKSELWGRKRKLAEGNVLRKGILDIFSRPLYDHRMNDLIEHSENEDVKKWLSDNKNSLFEHNSMFKKFLGGWPAQYLSTNIIESKNAFLKTLITCKKPAEKVFDDFLAVHKEEMSERIKAVSGRPSVFQTDFAISSTDWLKKSNAEKSQILESFGLESHASLSGYDNLPIWSLPSKVSREELELNVKQWTLHLSETDRTCYFVINSSNKHDHVYVSLDTDQLTCFGFICRNRSGFKFCLHTLIVFSSLSEEHKKRIVDDLESKRTQRTCLTMVREQMRPHHGTKIRRIGHSYSQGNHSRAFTAIIDTTASSIDEFNESNSSL